MIPTIFINDYSFINSWAVGIKQLNELATIIRANDKAEGHIVMTKDVKMIVELDRAAISQIKHKVVHPLYPLKNSAIDKYCDQFTYDYVAEQMALPEGDTGKFEYTYMERFVNYPAMFPITDNSLKSIIRRLLGVKHISGSIDQIKWLHDAIREDGISRRHQITTWIPQKDIASRDPPCLQRIQLRRLSSKYEPSNGKIPVEGQIDFRSRDFYGAFPSNEIALVNMLNKYILKDEFELVKLTDISFSGHGYESDWNAMQHIDLIPEFKTRFD